ncbi:hypothetical protein [Streptomyces sp. LS1784]|uniref:hypothetical protein n=1 Tax=Streptomyces sp. LS1784 TaxID=2851533 RepID=UPI001CCF78BB|nr:hypothetical protein [Streptomyces sp. LS1784]
MVFARLRAPGTLTPGTPGTPGTPASASASLVLHTLEGLAGVNAHAGNSAGAADNAGIRN